MTETEATFKLCCGPDGCGMLGNGLGNDDHRRYCIASRCMAWRWTMTPEEAVGNKHGPRGRCGLAGE